MAGASAATAGARPAGTRPAGTSGPGYPAAWATTRCATPETDPALAHRRPCHNFDWGMPTALTSVPAGRAACYVRGSDGALWQTCDSYGYSYRNCTSYVAWRVVAEGVRVAAVQWLGDAGSWARNVTSASVDRTPAAGSAAVLEGSPGHIAFVEAVLASGAIRVSEYNKFGAGGFDDRRVIGKGYVSRLRYIHFERLMRHDGDVAAAGTDRDARTSG